MRSDLRMRSCSATPKCTKFTRKRTPCYHSDSDCQTGFSSASDLRSLKQSRHHRKTLTRVFNSSNGSAFLTSKEAVQVTAMLLVLRLGWESATRQKVIPLFPLPRFFNMIGEGFLVVEKSLHSLMRTLIQQLPSALGTLAGFSHAAAAVSPAFCTSGVLYSKFYWRFDRSRTRWCIR